MEQSVMDESMMMSEVSVDQGTSQPHNKDDDDSQKRIMVIICCALLLLLLLLYFVVNALFIDEETKDDTDSIKVDRTYASGPKGGSQPPKTTTAVTTTSTEQMSTKPSMAPPPARRPSPVARSTTTSTTTTTYRPSNPNYVKKSITGLLCHTVVESYLTFAVPAGCDFFIADVSISVPTRHPRYSPYMATVNLKNATQKQAVMKRMQLAPGKGLILMVNRSALRPTKPQARPQAIVRGILQIVTDINADGVGLTDQSLRESDVVQVNSDAEILSDEMRQYHGLYRHESYTGSFSVFQDMVRHIATKSSLVFVYRVFGRATYFTAPYYTNFFMLKKNDTPVSDYIKRDIIAPLSQKQGSKAVALSMSLRVRKCTRYSLDGDQPPKCTELPLDFQHICDISTANIECHYYSVMTRRWNGGLDEDLTDLHFFEIEETVSRKARLMAQQLKQAGVKTIGIIVEHYEYDADKTVMTYSHDRQDNIECKVTPFGITNRTKAQLGKVL